MNEGILDKNQLPGAPIGERVLLLPDPPKTESEMGLRIPEMAQLRMSSGKVVAAGLLAMDKLHDHGVHIGDDVFWGRFAGVLWEWKHFKENGKKDCDHDWMRKAQPRDRTEEFGCSKCPAVYWIEPLLLANVDDIQASEGLEMRKRAGEVRYVRGVTSEGATQHVIKREEG